MLRPVYLLADVGAELVHIRLLEDAIYNLLLKGLEAVVVGHIFVKLVDDVGVYVIRVDAVENLGYGKGDDPRDEAFDVHVISCVLSAENRLLVG